jgi:predicted nucleic acid-binding protein
VAITQVEVVSAITRRGRGDARSQRLAASACALFLTDYAADFEIIEVSHVLLEQSVQLALSYGLRGYDAVQLAAGVELNRLHAASGLTPPLLPKGWRETTQTRTLRAQLFHSFRV